MLGQFSRFVSHGFSDREIKEEINILAAKNAKLNGLKVCLNASPPMNLNPELIKNIDILACFTKKEGLIAPHE